MPLWLAEHPTNAYFVLAILGVACAAGFFMTGKAKILLGLIAALLLVVAVFLIDFMVVTDAEQVERNARAMVAAAEAGDMNHFGSLISDKFSTDGLNKPDLVRRASHYLPPNPSHPRRITIWGVVVKRTADPNVILCRGSSKAHGIEQTWDDYPVYLELEFVKEDDAQWRIRKLRILDVVTGKNEVIHIPSGR